MRGSVLLDVRPSYPGVVGIGSTPQPETVFVVFEGQTVYYRSVNKSVTYGKV